MCIRDRDNTFPEIGNVITASPKEILKPINHPAKGFILKYSVMQEVICCEKRDGCADKRRFDTLGPAGRVPVESDSDGQRKSTSKSSK